MRVYTTLPIAGLLALLIAPDAAHAQLRRFPSTSSSGSDQAVGRRASAGDADADAARMLLGLSLGTTGTDRDTLGLLVTQVLRDGPADRAGIDEGNRIAEIDGVSLRLDPVDIGRQGAIDVVMRRLSRTLRGLQGGEQAALRVFAAGKFKNANVQLGNNPATPNAGGGLVISVPSTAPASAPVPAAVAAATDAPSRATTFTGAMQTLGDLQSQLRRLADDEGASPLADTLLQAARDIGVIQRRLRAAQADQQRRRTDDSADRPSVRRGGSSSINNSDVPGLSLSPVSDDLSDYFGDGSERGLHVLQADAAWSPIRNGDVILSVDGAPVSPSRLRDARDSRQPVRVELLRRRRQMTVTLNGREE
jgi:hypothetical protein